mmetsp:Transcript_100974/g.284819  ORF Transcript_100974/g.284819 Transcript_100974/m.284819 type:complete len:208 (+) Transcript_100974:68-691(+)
MGECQSVSETSATAPTPVAPTVNRTAVRAASSRAGVVAPEYRRYAALQYRDITPEDFELLALLADATTTTSKTSSHMVESLPQPLARDCGVTSCAVCLAEVHQDTKMTQLPCSHAFCKPCIADWLVKHKSECPLCRTPLGAVDSGSTTPGPAPTQNSALPVDSWTFPEDTPGPTSIPKSLTVKSMGVSMARRELTEHTIATERFVNL